MARRSGLVRPQDIVIGWFCVPSAYSSTARCAARNLTYTAAVRVWSPSSLAERSDGGESPGDPPAAPIAAVVAAASSAATESGSSGPKASSSDGAEDEDDEDDDEEEEEEEEEEEAAFRRFF